MGVLNLQTLSAFYVVNMQTLSATYPYISFYFLGQRVFVLSFNTVFLKCRLFLPLTRLKCRLLLHVTLL